MKMFFDIAEDVVTRITEPLELYICNWQDKYMGTNHNLAEKRAAKMQQLQSNGSQACEAQATSTNAAAITLKY